MPNLSRGRARLVTAEELARYLFGDPMDPEDKGVVGRLSEEVSQNTRGLGRVYRLAWVMLLSVFGVLLTMIADLMMRLNGHLPGP